MSKKFSDRRVLLAIGNSSYPNGPSPLSTSERSAQMLASLLREWGEFELCNGAVHTNVDRPHMESLLQSTFGSQKETTSIVDTAVFYFSGHGTDKHAENGELLAGFWFVTNENETLSAADVLGLIEGSPAQKILLILDCCHAGGLIARLGELHGRLLAGKKDVVIFASSEWDENAREIWGAPGSFFAEDLIAAAIFVEPDSKGFVTPGRWWEKFREEWAWSKENVPLRRNGKGDSQDPRRFGYEGQFSLFYVGCGEERAKRIASLPADFARRKRKHLSDSDLPRPLVSGKESLSDRPHPADLLRAGAELIPFFGREKEIEWLNTWLKGPEKSGVALLWAQGGEGKTRLALEWCSRLRKDGLLAGFVPRFSGTSDDDRLEQISQLRNLLDTKNDDPLVLVYDYAETRTSQAQWVLGKLTESKRPVRVLLLSRGHGEWFDRLGKENVFIEDLIAGAFVNQVQLDPTWDRRKMFEAACDEYARRLNKERPATQNISLDEEWLSQPLFLGMAALAAVDGRGIDNISDVLAKCVEHERRYWRGAVSAFVPKDTILQDMLVETLERAVALITLWGGISFDEAENVIIRVSTLPDDKSYLFRGIVTLLDGFYGRDFDTGHSVSGLEPDLLGEELVVQVLSNNNDLLGLAINNVDNEQKRSALIVLNRRAKSRDDDLVWIEKALEGNLVELAETIVSIAETDGGPIGLATKRVLEKSADVNAADALMSFCPPDHTVLTLAEISVAATSMILTHHRKKYPQPNATQLAETSRLLSNIGSYFFTLGLPQNALNVAIESIEISRELETEQPGDFLSNLAGALSNCGNYLAAVDRQEEALSSSSEAVEIYRELATKDSGTYLSDLSAALTNFSSRLSSLGRTWDAVCAMVEAIKNYRKLAAEHPERFLPSLANSLNRLGNRFSAAEHKDEALSVTTEAVEIYRNLAAKHPLLYLPDLAGTLANMSTHLYALNQVDESLIAITEAVDIFMELDTNHPVVFLSNLSEMLIRLASRLFALNRKEESLSAVIKAVENYRILASQQSDLYLPVLVRALTKLSKFFVIMDRKTEAKQIIIEAIKAYQTMPTDSSSALLPGLKSVWHGALGFYSSPIQLFLHKASCSDSSNGCINSEKKTLIW